MDEIEKMRFEEWKYRHDLFYRLFFRYTATVSVAGSLPILQAKSICDYNIDTKIIGAAAVFFSVIGVFHMVLEYSRVHEARRTLNVINEETAENLSAQSPIYAFLGKLPFDPFLWIFTISYFIIVCLSIFFFPTYTCS